MFKKTLFVLALLTTLVFAQNLSESSDFSYSIKLYNQEFYDLSAQQFMRFYTNYPNSGQADQAHYFAGMSYFNLGQFQKARVEFQSLAVGFPKSDRTAEAWLKSGLCSEKLNDPQEAVKAYETIRLLYPKSAYAAEGLYKAGVITLNLNQPIEALQIFNILMDQYSASPYFQSASLKAATSLYRMQKPAEAEMLVQKVLTQQPQAEVLAEALYISAQIKNEQGQTSEAKKHLLAIRQIKPVTDFQARASLLLADIYFSEQKYKQALEITDKDRKDPQIQLLAGDIYFLTANFEDALKTYRQIEIQEEDPLFLKLGLKIALSERNANLKENSRNSLKRILQKSPSRSSALFMAMDSIYLNWLEEDKDYDGALSYLNEQQGSGQNVWRKKLRMANILGEMERWRDVISILQPMMLIPENYAQKDRVLFLLAEAYRHEGQFADALHYYSKLNKDFAGSIYYADAAQQQSELQDYRLVDKERVLKKLTDITSEIVNGTESGILQFRLGRVYLEDLKDFGKAEQQFTKALNMNPGAKGDIHFYLGKTFLYQGYIKPSSKNQYSAKAIEQFKLAIQNISTCTVPDQASWYLVKESIESDTISVPRTKDLIEALLKKYPGSPLQEEWQANLAYRLAYESKFLNQSLKYFETLVSNYENSEQYPAYLFAFAQFLDQNNNSKALEYYKRIAADFPFAQPAAEALYKVAKDYEVKSQYADALTLYRKLIREYYYAPQAIEAHLKIGPLLVKTGDYTHALSLLKSALTNPFFEDQMFASVFLKNSDFNQIFWLAQAYEGIDQISQAIIQYKRYLKFSNEGPFVAQTHYNLGVIYYNQGQMQSAIDQFQSIKKKEAVLFGQAQMYLAQIYFDSGAYKQAASAYQELTKTNQDPAKGEDISAQYIVSLIRSGQTAQSKTAISKHKKLYKNQVNNSARFIVELADYYRLNKKFTNALKLLNQVKSKYKKSEYVDDADYTIALIDVTLNKTEDAFKILSNFYNNYPQSNKLASALNTLGNLYFRTEKYDNAITMFKNALKAKPEQEIERNIISNLIKTYTLTGFWDAAQALARQYVADYPDNADVLDKKIIIAQGYINLNQFQNAVDYLKKIKLESDAEREPEIQFYIGEAYLKGGQYENAIAEFVKIPLLSKKTKLQWEASALYYSGQSYEKLGRIPDAVRMYREIVDRPGIDLILKKEAQKRIQQIQ